MIGVSQSVQIPGYELLELVGEGGRGTVYRARQVSLDRTVAVKVLRADVPEQVGAVAFEREGRLMAALAHPNLVTIYDCGQADGQNYLVTEFVPGSTLRSRMTPGKPCPVREVYSLLDSIARALSYIHERGVLHLDLKPENILFTPEGAIKIADFGLAVNRVDARQWSALGMAQGTFDYCSPEQRFGLPTDECSDLFSFAVLAFELLTGRLPGRVYESARQLNPRLPASLDKVLGRALARDPAERQKSVEEFRVGLGECLAERRSRRRWVPLAGCAAAFLIAGMFLRPEARPTAAPILPGDSWVVVDESDATSDPEPTALPAGNRIVVRGLAPSASDGLDLPAWPEPRPVQILSAPNATGFVHFLDEICRPNITPQDWAQILQLPSLEPEDNFIQAGTFDGPCLSPEEGPHNPFWRVIRSSFLGEQNSLSLVNLPERPGRSALTFTRSDPLNAGREIGCYQWLSRIPDQAGVTVVLRFRARADEGTSRLKVMPHLPLLIPQDLDTPVTQRLRRLSVPMLPDPDIPSGVDARECRLQDWVRPGPEWRTYHVIWEWPSFCTSPLFRNIEILQVGMGKVWLDSVELFALPKRAAP